MLICDRYEATGGMHQGGMSQAHQCVDTRLNRKVILKTLQNQREIKRLDDEKKALLKIRSNHVVQLLDVISFESMGRDVACLVLEYIDGVDLQEGLYEISQEYLSVLWQIAKGLSEIHEAGVIHRDIKPNNVRKDNEGVIKIIDFGLSREAGLDNKTNSAIGFIPYMAPELLHPPVSFSTATDVYSFAVLALAIVKKGLPSCLNSMAPKSRPNLVTEHLGSIDSVLNDTLQACLSANPDNRPSMTDVVLALERVLLRNLHKARMVIGEKMSELSASKPSAKPRIFAGQKTLSQLSIKYDGNDFIVEDVIGTVKINNTAVHKGMLLPMSCVLAFEGGSKSFHYATFDVSSPEFMP